MFDCHAHVYMLVNKLGFGIKNGRYTIAGIPP